MLPSNVLSATGGHPNLCAIRSKSSSYLNSFSLSMILLEWLYCRGTQESDQSPWFSVGWPQIKVTEENRAGSGFWRSRLVVGHWSEFGSKSHAHSCSSLPFFFWIGLSLFMENPIWISIILQLWSRDVNQDRICCFSQQSAINAAQAMFVGA